MYKVKVLMSTYNGEKYITEQLKSIFLQKEVEVILHIRDDGSTDNTVNLIKKFKEKYSAKIYVEECDNIGPKRSFLSLICNTEDNCEYYALSDQDDIWDQEKLICAINKIKEENVNFPLIYGSPVRILDNGIDGGVAFTRIGCKEYCLEDFLIKNYYPGCTMVFNKALLQIIQKHNNLGLMPYPLHDHWINLVCTACGGKVIFDDIPHMWYRQHGNNVIGAYRSIYIRIKENGLFSDECLRSRTVNDLVNKYEDTLDEKNKIILYDILKIKKSIRIRFKLAINPKLKPRKNIEKIAVCLIILLGKF